MNKSRFLSIIFILIVFLQFSVKAQNSDELEKPCPVKSLPELFKKKDSILVLKPKKNSFFLIIPVIGSQPATGFSYGVVTLEFNHPIVLTDLNTPEVYQTWFKST